MNLNITQPNLASLSDVDSVYDAFLSISQQYSSASDAIVAELNSRMQGKNSNTDKCHAIHEFTSDLFYHIFQPLVEKISEFSPASPEQRDHPLREFVHEMLNIPCNLEQTLIVKLPTGNDKFHPEDIKPYLAYALIRNTEGQVFVTLTSTKFPIWKQ